MAKTIFNFSIDNHVIDGFKAVVPLRERSAMIQRFMESVIIQTEEDGDVQELLEEQQDIREKIRELSERLAKTSASIEYSRACKAKKQKEVMDRVKILEGMLKQHNPLHDIVD